MSCWSSFKEIIYKFDFFYTAELLRFRTQPQYRTLFGGFLSISIIIALLVTFYNKVISTFEKVIISSSFSALSADDPISYNISTMPGEPFMFGVQIWHHDLNANPRYFDVYLTNVFYNTGEYNDQKSEVIPLEPCTKEHWSEYPHIQSNYDRLFINYWLCLPKNREYQIFGKYASPNSKTLEVSVRKCTNSSDFEYPCASEADIDQFFQDEQTFFYTIYFINPLLNPDSQQYLSYYLEDSNYVIFSARGGEECQLWMEDFTITTDESILPFAEEKVETGGIVTKNCIKNHYEIDPTDPEAVYSTMMFFKSPISKSIGRNFQKIDEILSYIGGLFGTIAICLFLINMYNSYSFEILMGEYFVKPDDADMRKGLKKYNFLYFLLHLFYMLVSLLRCRCKWKTSKLFYDCREEMTKQLDISYLFKRLVILERGMETLLSDRQMRALHFFENPSLEQVKRKRRLYKTNHDSLIFRAASKADCCSEGASKGEKEPDKRPESREEPHHTPSGNEFSGKNGQPFSFVFNTPNSVSKSKIKKPEFLEEHSQESASDSEEDPTEESLKELAALKEEAKVSRTSQRIWSQLGDSVKQAVAVAQESFRSDLKLVNDHSYGFLADDLGDSPTLKNGRKSRLKRHRQLPKMDLGEKDAEIWSEKMEDKPHQGSDFFEMEDLSPEKKKS